MAPVTPLAITMGDAAGVGPEIVLRRAAAGALGDDVVVYGDEAILRRGAQHLGLAWPAELRIHDAGQLTAADFAPGVLSAAAGAAAREYVRQATVDALAGRVAGIVTMPINKEATQLSDPSFVGHTEYIAQLCGATRVTMMLVAGDLAVPHVSTHCSLR